MMRTPHAALAAGLLCLSLALSVVVSCSDGEPGHSSAPDGSAQDSEATDTGTEAAPPDASLDAPPDASAGDAPVDAPFDGLVFPTVFPQAAVNLSPPQVVTVTYPGDPMAAQLASFGSDVAQSAWWSQVLADYCESTPCTGATGIAAPQSTPPASAYYDLINGAYPDGGIFLQDYIRAQIASGSLPWPTGPTIYAFYVPSTTDVQLDGLQSCKDFDGYHNTTYAWTDGGAMLGVDYAVIMECSGSTQADLTTTSSHEIVEDLTDREYPYGYVLDVKDPNAWGWSHFQGAEIGDLCVDYLGLHQDRVPEGAFTVQRIWSYSQASLAHDPCVPVPTGKTYFTAYPQKAMFEMNVGETRTFTLTGFSDAPHADWYVGVQEEPTVFGYAGTDYLELSVSGSTIHAGKTLQVTMKLLADPTSSTPYGMAGATIRSTDAPTLAGSTAGAVWPFVVVSRAWAQDAGVSEPTGL